jgi:hypothetical protein
MKDGTVETSKVKITNDGEIITPYITIGKNGAIETKPEWSSEKWILLGDSITCNASFSGGINLNECRYFELISAKTGISVENKAISGTGYMR